MDRTQDQTSARMHQIDLRHIPGGYSAWDMSETSGVERNLQTPALLSDGAIRSPRATDRLDAKFRNQFGLNHVPLQVKDRSGVVIVHLEQHRFDPDALTGEDLREPW